MVDLETAAHDSIDEEDVPEERFYLGVITICPQQRGIATLLDGQQRLAVGGRVVGAFGYDRERGRFRVFKAKAVVVCTGGLSKLNMPVSRHNEYAR